MNFENISMEILKNKDIHKNCIERIEELHKDNEDMFKKYRESLTKYHISNEIAVKLKLNLVDIENKYNFIENQLNNIIDEKTVWTQKDEYMTTFLHGNGFEKPEELTNFITKYKIHKCKCNCPPVEDNEKYKEQVMFVDILKVNEKERLRVEKENEELRYDIDIGMKKRDKENNDLKNKILLLEKELEIYNKQVSKDNLNINNNGYIKKDIIVNSNNSKEYITSEDKLSSENVIINEIVSSDNNDFIKLKEENFELKNIIKLEKDIKESKDIKINELENKVQNYESQNNNKENDEKVLKDKKDKCNIPYLNKDNKYRCPIIKYKDINSKSKRKAAKETINEIIHYYELYETLKEEGKNIDEIVKYIIENKKIDIKSKTNRKTHRNKILRSHKIYEKYGEKLNDIYFNLTSMAKVYDILFEGWLEILDNCINNKENVEFESIEENNNDILIFKDIRNEITKNVEELDIKDREEYKKDINNNILYECKNPNCDDDEVEKEGDYCNYCKKDIKKCKICNTEFVNDELDVKNCEDCYESMELEGYYKDDE